MRASNPDPEIIALGEPMAEFAAEEPGHLGGVRTFRRGFGGDTVNFIVAAARMGASAGYVTRIGGDEFGRTFLALWEREGVDHSRVIVEPDGTTGVYFISRRNDGGHAFTYYRGGSPASRLRPEDLDAGYLASARVLHTSGISQAISTSVRETVEAAFGIVERSGGTISYDANIRPRLWPLELARVVVERTFARAHLVFLSKEDAAHLYPGVAQENVLERVLAFGPRVVVLKSGASGCTIATFEGERVHLAAWPVNVVDATGAGDAFAGAFVAEWLRGTGSVEAGTLASAAAAMTTMGLGAVDPIPTRAEVMDLIVGRQAGTHHRRE